MSRLYSAVIAERNATLAAIDQKIAECERTRADAELREDERSRYVTFAMTSALCVLRSLKIHVQSRELDRVGAVVVEDDIECDLELERRLAGN